MATATDPEHRHPATSRSTTRSTGSAASSAATSSSRACSPRSSSSAAWFALALVLDYGVFKMFTWDWVQDGSWWLRVVALVVGAGRARRHRRSSASSAGSRPSSPTRRWRWCSNGASRRCSATGSSPPSRLADVDRPRSTATRRDMIRQTIAEARERVGTVPVNDVFNWRRLRLMALLADRHSPRDRRGRLRQPRHLRPRRATRPGRVEVLPRQHHRRRTRPAPHGTRRGRGGPFWIFRASARKACASLATARRRASASSRTSGWWSIASHPDGWRPLLWTR